jgi:phosphotransacetylase
MCAKCQAAMAGVIDKGDGATAHAWDRASAAIQVWSKTLPDVEFDGEMDRALAWADHMDQSR